MSVSETEPTALVVDEHGWVHLVHAVTNGRTRIPADRDVLTAHQARGWTVTDPPDLSTPVVPTTPEPGEVVEWIEMVHPATGGVQLLPNNPDALAGARDAGWVDAAEAAALGTDGLTVAEVLAAVGDDPAKATAALAAERAGKNRTSLTSRLEAIAASTDPTAAAQD